MFQHIVAENIGSGPYVKDLSFAENQAVSENRQNFFDVVRHVNERWNSFPFAKLSERS